MANGDCKVGTALDARVTNNEKAIGRLEEKIDNVDTKLDAVHLSMTDNINNVAKDVVGLKTSLKFWGIIAASIFSIVSPSVTAILTTIAIFMLTKAF